MLLVELFTDYTLRTVLLGTTLFGVTGALIGCFTFMQGKSLLGDVISHATLPGIVLAIMLSHSKHPLMLLAGGLCSAALGLCSLHYIMSRTALKKDAALGLVLSVFFGLGLALMAHVQNNSHTGLIIKYIFGNANTIIHSDLYLISIVSITVFCVLFMLRKELSLCLFDKTQAQMLGFSTHLLQNIITLLSVLCIIVGLQLVGAILMSSFLIAPAAAARQWTQHFGTMTLLAGFFGGCSALAGTALSATYDMPTGPMIVIIASGIVTLSLIKKQIDVNFLKERA